MSVLESDMLFLTKERKEELCKGEVPVAGATKGSSHHLLVGELVGKEGVLDEQDDGVVSDDGHQDEENRSSEKARLTKGRGYT